MNENDTMAVLVNGLASIASNLGRGGVIGSLSDAGSRPLRIAASKTLALAGMRYMEYPSVEEDGWYKDGVRIGGA